jgi:hypothetical protein
MDNPCLSNEIDYLDNDKRLKNYTEQVSLMSDEDVREELNNLFNDLEEF